MKRLRWTMLLVGFLLTTLIPSTVLGAQRLHRSFDEAAEAFGVPVELLGAVSNVTSSWHRTRDQGAESPLEFGVMGLRGDGSSPGLEEAASLLGVPLESVRDEDRYNILGGAALLASYAREAAGGSSPGPEITLDNGWAWWEAAARYSGIENPVLQDMFAVHVFEAMDRGLEGRAPTGEMLYFAPAVMPGIIGDWIQAARARYRAMVRAAADATDYAGAAWVPACSSNYTDSNRGPSDIYYVVIHISEGSYAGTISWFQNCSSQVSAHYVVSKYGEVTQMVREADIAWHAGNWDYNVMSVGIEHEGHTTDFDITDAEYQASAALTADICARNGIPTTRDYIIGHDEVPGAGHSDPGPYWDWDYYMSLVNGGAATNTADLVGFIREDDIYTGAAIPGATVRLSTGQATSADGDGFYRFEDLEVGTYTVTASADCYASASKTKTLEPGIDNWASIALSPDGSCEAFGSIIGDVRDTDTLEPVPYATVTLDTGETTQTDRSGRFEFLQVPAGTHTLEIATDCYFPATVTLTVVEGQGSSVVVDLDPDPACTPSCGAPATGQISGLPADTSSHRRGPGASSALALALVAGAVLRRRRP